MVHLNLDNRLTPERAKKQQEKKLFCSSQVISRLNSSFSLYMWFPHLYKQPSLIIVLTQHISAFPKQERKWISKKIWNSLHKGGVRRGIRRKPILSLQRNEVGLKKKRKQQTLHNVNHGHSYCGDTYKPELWFAPWKTQCGHTGKDCHSWQTCCLSTQGKEWKETHRGPGLRVMQSTAQPRQEPSMLIRSTAEP